MDPLGKVICLAALIAVSAMLTAPNDGADTGDGAACSYHSDRHPPPRRFGSPDHESRAHDSGILAEREVIGLIAGIAPGRSR